MAWDKNPIGVLSNGTTVTPDIALEFYDEHGAKYVMKCPHCGNELILHRTEPPHFEHKAGEADTCDARGKQ